MSDSQKRCPQCGHVLRVDESGRIGHCPHHKLWYPVVPSAEGDASRQNAADEKERLRIIALENEARKASEIAADKRRKVAILQKLLLGLVLIATVAIVIILFVIRPKLEYDSAESALVRGEYKQAQQIYTELGDYKDSANKAKLCHAMIALGIGDSDSALQILEQMIGDNQEESAAALQTAFIPLVTNWESSGFTPHTVLYLLEHRASIDPDNQLDYDRLNFEAHKALLGEEARSCYAWNVDGDADFELIVLNSDFTISAYDMNVQGNAPIAMDSASRANSYIHFGDEYCDTVIDDAIVCYQRANTEQSDGAALPKLIHAYQTRAIQRETAGDIEGALDDALQFALLDDSQEGFIFHYEMLLRYCISMEDKSAAFEVWKEHISSNSEKVRQYASHRSVQDSSQLLFESLKADSGNTNCERDGNVITYCKLLPGSIKRYEQCKVTVTESSYTPVRVGIDWQSENYPYPNNAQLALLRYLEARTYTIDQEASLLISETGFTAMGFDLAAMQHLAAPDSVESIAIGGYVAEKDVVLFEAMYLANEKQVRRYFAVTNDGEYWKVAGVSETYSPEAPEQKCDFAIDTITLNSSVENRLSSRSDIDSYRIMLPQASEVSLLWQAGTESKNRAFTATLYSADDMTKAVISYDLALSAGKQLTNPLYLQPGVYYISIAARNYADVPYTLTVQATPNAYIESECNDTIPEADAISLNQQYSGSLMSKEDMDCYIVELSSPGKLAVSMQAGDEGKSSVRYHIDIGTASTGKLLTAFDMTGDTKLVRSCNLYLAAGRYVIQISSGSYASSAAYRLQADFSPMESCENELNDTADTATNIQVNTKVVGSFGVSKERDYFTFTLAQDSIIQPKLSFAPLETSAKTYVLTLYDGTNLLHTINIGGKENQKIAIPFALPAGTYTLELRNPHFNMQDYTLTIVAENVDAAEAEPHDALANASLLTVAVPMTGILSHEEDTDIYKLVLTEETITTLRFTFPASTVEGAVYSIQLEQNGKRQWSTTVKGSTGGFEQALQIPAGEYYIRVKPVTWISSVYTIELK